MMTEFISERNHIVSACPGIFTQLIPLLYSVMVHV